MTFIQADGKITSAATDSTGARLVDNKCPICGVEVGKIVDLPIQFRMEELEFYVAKDTPLSDIRITVEHIDGAYEHYYPKYCPECGRKLHD